MATGTAAYSHKQSFLDHRLHIPGLVLAAAGLGAFVVGVSYLGSSTLQNGIYTITKATNEKLTASWLGLGFGAVVCGGGVFIWSASHLYGDRQKYEQGIENGQERNSETEKSLRRGEWIVAAMFGLGALGVAALMTFVATGGQAGDHDCHITEERMQTIVCTGFGMMGLGTATTVIGLERHNKRLKTNTTRTQVRTDGSINREVR
jgi:hypothetical protein